MSGIYIHIPFCKQACHYCNFHFSTSLKLKDDFLAALKNEINLTAAFDKKENSIETLYFGGGTPSILSVDDLQVIFDALQRKFVFTNNIEITLEANPDDITEEKLKQWKSIGINRFSVGTQSFVEEELQWMNRAHTAKESLICIDKIQQAGFDNFSIDLIYGSPILTNDLWQKNVEIVINKNIPHVSCYALTVEPKTALDKLITQQKKAPLDAEKQADQFTSLMIWMQSAGYEHYEISNYAKPGFRSKHNSSYWQQKKYYGFGPSAHSFDGKSRRWNIANNALYIQSLKKDIVNFEEEILTPTQVLNEYIMTSLRTMEGLKLEVVSDQFGKDKSWKLEVGSKKWQDSGKLQIANNSIILTTEGKLFADGIAADLFF